MEAACSWVWHLLLENPAHLDSHVTDLTLGEGHTSVFRCSRDNRTTLKTWFLSLGSFYS